jgi:hypothetical protein
VEFSSEDIEIIDELDGPTLVQRFANFGFSDNNSKGEDPSSDSDFGNQFNWPEGVNAKFQGPIAASSMIS